jgi:hypothetical protein
MSDIATTADDDKGTEGRWWSSAFWSCVYRSIYDDQKLKDVVNDDAMLGAWLHLLMAADITYPEPAQIPKRTNQRRLDHLVNVGVIDLLAGGRYTFRGLDLEREHRGSKGRAGGLARAATAGHEPGTGHFTKGNTSVAGSTAGEAPTTPEPASLDQRTSQEEEEGRGRKRERELRTVRPVDKTDDDERDAEKVAQDAAIRASGVMPAPIGLPTPERAGALFDGIRAQITTPIVEARP